MKTPGLDSALSALKYWRTKSQVVANNLANVASPGFKAQIVFADLLPGDRPEARAELDLTAGALQETGNPLDMVIGEVGFFVVDTPAGERLTRAGSFALDDLGYLVDASGRLILGDTGGILIPPAGEIQIDPTGDIYVDGTLIDRIRVERPEPGTRLSPEGSSLLRADGRLETVPPDARGIRQRFIEESNVESITGMTDLIEIQRSYAAVLRAVEALDGVAATVVNDIARPT